MDHGGEKMILNRHMTRRQRGVISIEAAVVSALIGITLASIGGWVKYDGDFKNDRAAADSMALVLRGAQSWFNANTATIAAAANPSVNYAYNQWATSIPGNASGNFSPTNIYGQTYTMRVYKEPSGQLDMMVLTLGGATIPDGSLTRISKMLGGAGGYVSNAAPGVVQNAAAGWSMPVGNIGGSPGVGHLAAAAFFANAAQANDYLYRHQVGGHPELNQMSTTLDMNQNNIANAALVAASGVAVTSAAGGNATVSLNNSQLLDNNGNLYVRSNGTVNVQNVAGSAWAPMTTGAQTVVGDQTVFGNRVATGSDQVNGNQVVGGSQQVNGNSTVLASQQINGNSQVNGQITTYGSVNLMTNGASVYNPNTMYVSAGQNLYLNPFGGNRVIVGGGGGNGQLETTGRMFVDEYLQPGVASAGAACDTPGLVGRDGNGSLFCNGGRWQSASAVPSGTTCGGVTIRGSDAHPNDPASTEIPCMGVAFWQNGVCPSGFYYAAVFAASALWHYTCVKS
ncbi:shufflon system plasmid conjugative transfer pilus tip adhesin PilV (plasmid) [Paraburkholderia sprentiae WSM5005]|uniref:Shufflon system plasmid conjugative transfer pilus tip adhesin PilV n=1 Tax=Paraburkholderia sprentiae WSM5005 TaxID=754502 RepID=A0ACA8AWW4_9BURK|nr:shufflon system plasmid conjugative transfer pilus tip adhesin PilV [Paraburkholderia sprentiae]APA90231.2 shufflon system plasmid conjugative transfer pilus tip adhesin PilV [Paraburkholderia sprentiae WSM5005]